LTAFPGEVPGQPINRSAVACVQRRTPAQWHHEAHHASFVAAGLRDSPTRSWDDIVNLARLRRRDGRCGDWSKSSRRILGKFGEFAPCNEPGCELFAMKHERLRARPMISHIVARLANCALNEHGGAYTRSA